MSQTFHDLVFPRTLKVCGNCDGPLDDHRLVRGRGSRWRTGPVLPHRRERVPTVTSTYVEERVSTADCDRAGSHERRSVHCAVPHVSLAGTDYPCDSATAGAGSFTTL
jgi:hypothetical protein